MTLIKSIFFLLSITSCNLAFGISKEKIFEQRAANFLLKTSTTQAAHIYSQALQLSSDVCIPPSNGECINFVAGSYANQNERLEAARACVGNFGASCVTFTAGSYASFNERVASAKACRNNLNDACANFVAGSYSNLNERIGAASACANADVQCVKYTAGNYASYNDRVAAAKACSGQ